MARQEQHTVHEGQDLSSLLAKVGPPMVEGLAKGILPWYIMHLLGENPLYGYEIIRHIGQMTRGTWKPSPGSVYPLLHGFEKDGLIVGDWERGKAAPKRRYRLTDKGKAAVPVMQRELVERLTHAKVLIEHHITFLSQGLDDE
jgi:DNA-binding PadR family transcriptional regulator